ncbi:unnamed protein product, partial [Musa banksii]
MNRTIIIVRCNYLRYVKEIPKASMDHDAIIYSMRRGTQTFLHTSPCFVTLGFVRPLAKTVPFNVLKFISARSTSGGGQKAFSA